MDVQRRSEREIRNSLSKAVAWRWHERLLFTTECQAERVASRGEWLLGLVGRAHSIGGQCVDTMHRKEDGLVGVTKGRLVYQERARHGLMFIVTSLALALIAVAVLFRGDGLHGFLYFGVGAVGVWIAGRVAEAFGVGSGYMEFDRIRHIDRAAQRIDGLGRWGTLYKLRIPDPSDFRLIAAIAKDRGAAAV